MSSFAASIAPIQKKRYKTKKELLCLGWYSGFFLNGCKIYKICLLF